MKPAVKSKKRALIAAVIVGAFGLWWYFDPFPWLGAAVGLVAGLFVYYLLSSSRMETGRRLFFIGLNLLVIASIVVVIAQMGMGTFLDACELDPDPRMISAPRDNPYIFYEEYYEEDDEDEEESE